MRFVLVILAAAFCAVILWNVVYSDNEEWVGGQITQANGWLAAHESPWQLLSAEQYDWLADWLVLFVPILVIVASYWLAQSRRHARARLRIAEHDLRIEAEQYRAKVTQYSTQLVQAKDEAETLRQRLNALSNVQLLEERLERAVAKAEEQEGELETLRPQLYDARQQLAETKCLAAEHKAKLEQLQISHDELARRYNTEREAIERLQTERLELSKEVATLQSAQSAGGEPKVVQVCWYPDIGQPP